MLSRLPGWLEDRLEGSGGLRSPLAPDPRWTKGLLDPDTHSHEITASSSPLHSGKEDRELTDTTSRPRAGEEGETKKESPLNYLPEAQGQASVPGWGAPARI